MLRTATPEDNIFYFRVYASTRTDEMALVNWTAEQKEAFLLMQFNAQTEHYRIHYPLAEYQIIQRDGDPIGRLIVERTKDQLLIMDIVLLPEYRNSGVGTGIIKDLMAEAARSGVPLVLRVEFFNPVIRLYTRLGFVKTREVNSVYHEMVWTPAASSA
jgi:GNAT superfamily N-acetyltransferase